MELLDTWHLQINHRKNCFMQIIPFKVMVMVECVYNKILKQKVKGNEIV